MLKSIFNLMNLDITLYLHFYNIEFIRASLRTSTQYTLKYAFIFPGVTLLLVEFGRFAQGVPRFNLIIRVKQALNKQPNSSRSKSKIVSYHGEKDETTDHLFLHVFSDHVNIKIRLCFKSLYLYYMMVRNLQTKRKLFLASTIEDLRYVMRKARNRKCKFGG